MPPSPGAPIQYQESGLFRAACSNSASWMSACEVVGKSALSRRYRKLHQLICGLHLPRCHVGLFRLRLDLDHALVVRHEDRCRADAVTRCRCIRLPCLWVCDQLFARDNAKQVVARDGGCMFSVWCRLTRDLRQFAPHLWGRQPTPDIAFRSVESSAYLTPSMPPRPILDRGLDLLWSRHLGGVKGHRAPS